MTNLFYSQIMRNIFYDSKVTLFKHCYLVNEWMNE